VFRANGWIELTHELNTEAIAVIAGCFVLWGALARRLERWNLSAPLVFVVFGLAVTHPPLSLMHLNLHSSTIRYLAELTLALILFSDASRVSVRQLRSDIALPVRLLAIGLPLTIGFGTAAAAALFGGSSLWLPALIAAIVAPTDAALGASILQDKRVPSGVRRLLNVESGLNDGMATPFVNLFLAGVLSQQISGSTGITSSVVDVLLGAVIGAAVGGAGAWILMRARLNAWSDGMSGSLAVLGLALLGYALAVESGTNGFVAAFVAGIAYGALTPTSEKMAMGFTDRTGELLSLLVWFAFGAIMLIPGLEDATWRDVAFAVLALTVIRIGSVAVATLGSGLGQPTVLFVGWFGPRGLASVVFALIAVDTLDPSDGRTVLAAVTMTVALSVVAHGVSALPFTSLYLRGIAGLERGRPEHTPSTDIPVRALHPEWWHPPHNPDKE